MPQTSVKKSQKMTNYSKKRHKQVKKVEKSDKLVK